MQIFFTAYSKLFFLPHSCLSALCDVSNTGIVHPMFKFRSLHLRDGVQDKENVNNRPDYVGLNLLKSQHLVNLIAFIREIGMAKPT